MKSVQPPLDVSQTLMTVLVNTAANEGDDGVEKKMGIYTNSNIDR